MSIQCAQCQTSINEASVDRNRQIATCPSCGWIVDLQRAEAAPGNVHQATPDSAAPDPRPRARNAVALPAGMAISEDAQALTIRRRWLRGKHFLILLVLESLTAVAVFQWTSAGFSVWLLVMTVILALLNLRLLEMFVNTTTIRAFDGRVEVRHGPVPSLQSRNQSLATADIQQLFASKWGSLFEVGAQLRDGRRVPLVRPVVSAEQALFVEQRLEQRLGLIDFQVPGEIGSLVATPASVSRGGGGLLVVLLLIIVPGAVIAFVAATSSTVEGTLTGSGDRMGAFTFVADDCSSGQTRGFAGVELSSEQLPGTVVRPIRDPVKGTIIAVERGGGQPVVLTQKDCNALDIQIERTNTNVNDVWGVRGSARVDCAELRGTVTFDGCY